MILQPKFGTDTLLFGMKEADVTALLGKPNASFKDDDDNTIYVYNEQKLRLTFYQDEDLKLGYIISSNPKVVVEGLSVIGKPIDQLKKELTAKGYKSWETESFDTLNNHFCEDFWLILQAEFNEIVKVELGAIINAKDEFEWKFKG